MPARPVITAPSPAADLSGPVIGTAHRRRLRDVWRSAGWPCQDVIEAELLAAGLLERREDGAGRMSVRVSDAGLQVLAQTAERNRAARSAHEDLVAQVATTLARDGRIAWRGLSLRARVNDEAGQARWQMAMPDVYSVRHTSVAAYLQPVVHEIKVRRADLLADLRRPAKRAAYLQMAGALYYVLAEGIAEADEVPPECGVLMARPAARAAIDEDEALPMRLEVARPAPTRALPNDAGLPFAVWMALARATPVAQPSDPQLWLGAQADAADPAPPKNLGKPQDLG